MLTAVVITTVLILGLQPGPIVAGPMHLNWKGDHVKVVDSKTLWKQSLPKATNCDSLCVRKSDIPLMWGMNGVESFNIVRKGILWTCPKVCPKPIPIVRGFQIVNVVSNKLQEPTITNQ